MNRDFLEKFVDQIEELLKTIDKSDYVLDRNGSYLK